MKKLNCWEFKKCGKAYDGTKGGAKSACPASVEAMLNGVHGGTCAGRACWTVAGTVCKGKAMGVYPDKLEGCIQCDFYKSVMQEEGDKFLAANDMLRYAESGVPVIRMNSMEKDDQGGVFTRDELEGLFNDAVIEGLRRTFDECGYYESRFVYMIKDMGAVKAVKRVLNKQQFLFGVSELSRHKCLKYSMERLVLDYRFGTLFNENERMAALARLRSCDCNGLGRLLLGAGTGSAATLTAKVGQS